MSALTAAQTRLLTPGGLDDSRVAAALGRVLGHRVDAADIYFQSSRHESWVLEDGRVREGAHSIEQGVGVRAMAGLGPGPHRSGDIAQALRARVQSVAPIRQSLIKKGMIYSPALGDTAFTVPLFDQFMLRTMPKWKRTKPMTRGM
jgi:hypothetical protein